MNAASARWRSPTRRPRRARRSSSAASRRARTRSGATRTSCPWRARPARRCPPAGRRSCKADRLAAQLGLARGLGQERDGQPDALLQGPRRLRRARSCPGARLRDDRLCLHRQPRQRRRRARRGRRAARLRADPRRPRGGEDPRHRRLRGHRGRGQGQLRRRQPAVHADRRRAPRLGVRQRQRAALLRRGLQDARLRGRRAARLGAARPRSSRRSPRARCSRRSRGRSRSGSTAGCSRASCRR